MNNRKVGFWEWVALEAITRAVTSKGLRGEIDPAHRYHYYIADLLQQRRALRLALARREEAIENLATAARRAAGLRKAGTPFRADAEKPKQPAGGELE